MSVAGTPEDHDTLPPSQDPEPAAGLRVPPRDFWGIVRSLGPGLIIAGSIVGSGELISTTKTGAQAGIALLWLIVIGCVIKVFVQVELGRYTISHGETTLSALDQMPGPRFGVSWIIWYWAVMMLASMGQLGGIVGGVGQAMAISFPITGDYADAVQIPAAKDFKRYLDWEADQAAGGPKFAALSEPEQQRVRRGQQAFEQDLSVLGERGVALLNEVREGKTLSDPRTRDDKLWACLAGVITAILLVAGRYRMIQNVSTVMVVAFTFITLGNVFALQTTERWAISMQEWWLGLSFSLPPAEAGINPVHTAMATFGIIGVGATELIAYPYWCLEKGYAKFAGERSDDPSWGERARGWVRVMQWDAFASLVVYTVATLAFFMMGVAVLYREGRDPEGMRMVSTLARAYVPVFGEYARWLFLIGAIAVLYSTYLVASAGHTRTIVDALKLFGVVPRHNERAHLIWLKVLSFVFPLLCLGIFLTVTKDPVELILLSGIMQAIMLPMLAGSALYFRYTRTDRRLAPTPLWDAMLLVSSLGLFIAGAWGAYSQVLKMLG
jgi:Mn2+/Fe2+ NRAMP family transporter